MKYKHRQWLSLRWATPSVQVTHRALGSPFAFAFALALAFALAFACKGFSANGCLICVPLQRLLPSQILSQGAARKKRHESLCRGIVQTRKHT